MFIILVMGSLFSVEPFCFSPQETQVIHIRTDKKTDIFFLQVTLDTAALESAESLSCTKEENTQTAISKALKSTFSVKNRNSGGCFISALYL